MIRFQFENNMGNMKRIWQRINELLHRRKKNLKAISALKDLNNRNKIIKDGSRIPNILNEHFATMGNRLAHNLPTPQTHHLDNLVKCKSPTSSFLFHSVLPDEQLLITSFWKFCFSKFVFVYYIYCVIINYPRAIYV